MQVLKLNKISFFNLYLEKKWNEKALLIKNFVNTFRIISS